MFRCTKSARICTRTVAAVVRTGKNESNAEYAAPLAIVNRPSSNDANSARRRRYGNWRIGRTADHGVTEAVRQADAAEDLVRQALKTSRSIGSNDRNTTPRMAFSK